MKFEKYSGAGNRFAIQWKSELKTNLNPALIKKIVQSSLDPQVDGVVFLEEKNPKEYQWDFFNSDGSSAEMCGNAARCVSLFLKNHQVNEGVVLKTIAGPVELNPQIQKVTMPSQGMKIKAQEVDLDTKKISGFYVNTGVPHFLVNQAQFHLTEAECQTLRNHKDFQPQGTNVTLYEISSATAPVKAKTFERGVEGFTLACGTGAIAVGQMMAQKNNLNETEIIMPGGHLHIKISAEIVELSGHTEFLGSFEARI